MKPTLTERDTYILRDLARLQLLSTKQIAARHFGDPASKAPANRMRRLKMFGFVKSVYAPLNSEETKIPTRPAAIWLFPPDCQKNVRRFLEAAQRASDWALIADEIVTFNKAQKFAQQSLVHEVGISEVLLALETHAPPQHAPAFLLRTSPRHEDVSSVIEVTRTRVRTDTRSREPREVSITKKQTINPDAFVCIRYPDATYSFLFFEYDNDTSNEQTFFEKLEGYYAYLKQGHFADLCQRFSERYNLGIRNASKASFRVVTVVNSKTNPTRRLHKLFAGSLKLPTDTFYNFTTLGDFQRDPYGTVFLNKQAFAPLKSEYVQSVQPSAPTVQRSWFDAKLPALARVSLL